MEKELKNRVNTVAEKTHIPLWGAVGIMIFIILICGSIFFCVRRFLQKRRGKVGNKGIKAVDLKLVQLPSSALRKINDFKLIPLPKIISIIYFSSIQVGTAPNVSLN